MEIIGNYKGRKNFNIRNIGGKTLNIGRTIEMPFHAMTERKNSRFNLRSNHTEIALDICGHMV